MIASTRPIALPGEETCDPPGCNRFSRILGRPTESASTSRITERLHDRGDAWRIVWFDACTNSSPTQSNGPTIAHILWTQTGGSASIHIGDVENDAPDFSSREVNPGDTLRIPPKTPFTIAPGVLGLLLTADRSTTNPAETNVPAATHGLQIFERYNRRTICAVMDDFVLERWKLTQPQRFDLVPSRWHALINLVSPVALSWRGGSDITRRAQTYLLPAGMTDIFVTPDNLGYILLAYHSGLERDVITPLRAAGYDPATISSIGVHRWLIGR